MGETLSATDHLAIGVDVGGSFLKAGLVDRDGHIYAKINWPISKETLDALYAQLAELVEHMRKTAQGAELIGIGLGIPGFINQKTGIIDKSPNIPSLDGARIVETLNESLPLPVSVDNDANAAALGEYWVGGGGKAQLLILLTLGTGIGGGIILRGEIWHGASGYAGEIGHTVIVPDGPSCNCGRRGCLEAVFSDTAFVRDARGAIAAGRKTTIRNYDDRLRAGSITEAAEAGDKLAMEILKPASRYLGMAIGSIINALNPDQIVLGGGIIAAADLLIPMIMEGVHERAIAGPLADCTIRPSALGNDAGLIGAAGLAWRKFERDSSLRAE